MPKATRLRLLSILPSQANESGAHKVTKGCSGWRFYFVDKDAFEKFRDHVLADCHKHVIEIISPESEEQLQLLKADEKVVFRQRLFYNQYQWKVELGGITRKQDREDFHAWAVSFFADQNDAKRVKLSKSRMGFILYCNHEDDVAMTKLVYSQWVKNITHAIAVPNPNNNNNKGTTHASIAIPPSS
jgi:hypothetical protein